MQEAKGRNESRDRRVDWEPQVDFSSERSWAVKKAREVLRLLWDIVGGMCEVDVGVRLCHLMTLKSYKRSKGRGSERFLCLRHSLIVEYNVNGYLINVKRY